MEAGVLGEFVSIVDVEATAIILREHDYANRYSPSGSGFNSENLSKKQERTSNLQSKGNAVGVRSSTPDPGSNFQSELDGDLEKVKKEKQLVSSPSPPEPVMKRWCVSDGDFQFFTRFPSEDIFLIFWMSIEPSASRVAYWSKASSSGSSSEEDDDSLSTPQSSLAVIDEFLMFCLHLALGQKDDDLAKSFGVSASRVSQILIRWTNYLYLLLGSVPVWMTRSEIRQTNPQQILPYCQNVRVVVACTELTCENPEANVFSDNLSAPESCLTLKALIGIAPCGLITFASKLFSGSVSDKELMMMSGLLTLLEPGDELVADKGYDIKDLLNEVSAKLVTFPIENSMCIKNLQKAQTIARHLVLIERAVKRIKEYRILDPPIPLSIAGRVNQIWTCCCMLANYQGSLDPDGKLMNL